MMGLNLRTRPSAAPVAVVTGADHPTGLGSGRALHKIGAHVCGITNRPEAPACRSRVWKRLHVTDAPTDSIAALRELATDMEAPAFLLPTDDRTVMEISERRADLDRVYRMKLPPHEIVGLFMQKTRFHGWARDRGLPLPQTHVAESESDLKTILKDMPYPLIVKPLYRTLKWDELSPVQKVLRLESPGDRRSIPFDLFATAPAYVVSEWIAGPDHAVHYCLAYCSNPGEITASYSGRKLLQYPRRTGSSAVCVGTKAGEVRELAETLFSAAEFEGLGSLEVKYGQDGRPYITEPTVGRPNLQSYSAVVGGCNLHAVAMADALGMDMGSYVKRPRKSWWIQEGAVLELLSPSERDEPVPWSLLFRELFTSHTVGGAYAAWWDPRPLLALLWETVRRGVRFLLRSLRSS